MLALLRLAREALPVAGTESNSKQVVRGHKREAACLNCLVQLQYLAWSFPWSADLTLLAPQSCCWGGLDAQQVATAAVAPLVMGYTTHKQDIQGGGEPGSDSLWLTASGSSNRT